ncbi:hypothetical protein BRARA_C03986 [Brassica rapa]|uniref:Acyl-[acyl-carrier-protein] hydrolase n=1 Tax=Brassica campestris TaxID=3711 RepID=A0A398A927_BRACM|nr:hypothetical protein BRARA_C03986 [Brassica rapa]
MLKLSCNATDKLLSFSSHSHQSNPVHRINSFSVSCSQIRKPGLTPLRAAVSADQESVIRRTRFGHTRGLTEDGLSYKEKFIVRSHEVQSNKTATVQTIANLLQEVGCNQFQSVGFSTDGFATTPTMRKLNLIWVTSRMHIEIYKYPAWGDVVEIETWCQSEGRIGTRRDWILKDLANGEVTDRATSKWVMMNQDTRRLQKVSDDIRDEHLIFCPKEPRLAFPEEENNRSLKKILKLEDPAQYLIIGLKPRRADLDMNHHVNNVTYIGWLLESIPQEIVDTHELQVITLDYRGECQQDDVVDSLTTSKNGSATSGTQSHNDSQFLHLLRLSGDEIGGTNSSATSGTQGPNDSRFLHLLRLSGDGQEINRGTTLWR